MFKKILDSLNNYRTEKIFCKRSFSTKGEDLLINSILLNIQNGFYVDVGAHHPFRFSNTHLLYKRGWKGINIDANSKSIQLFNRYRKKDINVLNAISDKEEKETLYKNEFGATNTLLKEKYQLKPESYIEKMDVITKTLTGVLQTYIPEQERIDFLNVDVEGYDYKVLNSFPWEKYTPYLICVEDLDFQPDNPHKSYIYKFLIKKNYKYVAFIPFTLFFISSTVKSKLMESIFRSDHLYQE